MRESESAARVACFVFFLSLLCVRQINEKSAAHDACVRLFINNE